MCRQFRLGNKIYVVDRDLAVRDALCFVLEYEGYQVTTFADGASLLAAMRECIPDCTILDVRTADLSSLDILKEANSHDFRAPIVITCDEADGPMVREAIKLGAFDFIEKPFDADAIVSHVREAIGARAHSDLPSEVNP